MNPRNLDRVHVAGTILLTTGCLYGALVLLTKFVHLMIDRTELNIEIAAGDE